MGTLPPRSQAQSGAGQLLGISSAPAGAGAAQRGDGKAQEDCRAQRTELGSFSGSQCQKRQGAQAGTQECLNTRKNFFFLPCGWWSTNTDCPERCWGLLLGDLLRLSGRGAAQGGPAGAGVGPEGPRGASGLCRAVVLRDQRPALAGLILPQDGSQPAARGTGRSSLRFLRDRASVLCHWPSEHACFAFPGCPPPAAASPPLTPTPWGVCGGPASTGACGYSTARPPAPQSPAAGRAADSPALTFRELKPLPLRQGGGAGLQLLQRLWRGFP